MNKGHVKSHMNGEITVLDFSASATWKLILDMSTEYMAMTILEVLVFV